MGRDYRYVFSCLHDPSTHLSNSIFLGLLGFVIHPSHFMLGFTRKKPTVCLFYFGGEYVYFYSLFIIRFPPSSNSNLWGTRTLMEYKLEHHIYHSYLLVEITFLSANSFKNVYYTLGGSELEEMELPHLDRHKKSRPVRIGNGTATHIQQVHASSCCSRGFWFGYNRLGCGSNATCRIWWIVFYEHRCTEDI